MYYLTSFKRIKAKKTTSFNGLVNELAALKNIKRQDLVTKKVTYKNKRPLQIQDPKVVEGLKELDRYLTYQVKQYPQATKINHFSIFQIPKASGGFRTIKAPDDTLKEIYTHVRYLIEFNLKSLSHDVAFAYTRKRSTVDALKKHQENDSEWYLKIDIEGFFDHCDQATIAKQLSRIHPFYANPSLCERIADFATLEDALPQGTPLSPILTNIIMTPFDHHMEEYCLLHNMIYTRYADDILISSKEGFKFSTVIGKVENLFTHLEYPFTIKKSKTRYGNRNGRNWNLGLMLNKNNDITVGHQFKREIKVILHKFATNELPKNDLHYLGLLAYLKQIEPQYYAGLDSYCMRKYRKRIKTLTVA